MSRGASFLASKPVLDPDANAVGRIAGAERDPDTRDTRSFLVELDPAQLDEGAEPFCWLPVDRVQGIRRDGVQLTDRLSAILPP